METLEHLFHWVCGQNADHTWAPGGWLLPCCQRCVGLYGGALLALALTVLVRPRPTSAFLTLHGLMLLFMAPFGFHWVSQGPLVRTLTGYLFGFGVVAFLWLVPRAGLNISTAHEREPQRAYWLWASLGFVVLAALAGYGGRFGAALLTVWVTFGLAVLAGLAGGNLTLALVGLFRWLVRRPTPGIQVRTCNPES